MDDSTLFADIENVIHSSAFQIKGDEVLRAVEGAFEGTKVSVERMANEFLAKLQTHPEFDLFFREEADNFDMMKTSCVQAWKEELSLTEQAVAQQLVVYFDSKLTQHSHRVINIKNAMSGKVMRLRDSVIQYRLGHELKSEERIREHKRLMVDIMQNEKDAEIAELKSHIATLEGQLKTAQNTRLSSPAYITQITNHKAALARAAAESGEREAEAAAGAGAGTGASRVRPDCCVNCAGMQDRIDVLERAVGAADNASSADEMSGAMSSKGNSHSRIVRPSMMMSSNRNGKGDSEDDDSVTSANDSVSVLSSVVEVPHSNDSSGREQAKGGPKASLVTQNMGRVSMIKGAGAGAMRGRQRSEITPIRAGVGPGQRGAASVSQELREVVEEGEGEEEEEEPVPTVFVAVPAVKVTPTPTAAVAVTPAAAPGPPAAEEAAQSPPAARPASPPEGAAAVGPPAGAAAAPKHAAHPHAAKAHKEAQHKEAQHKDQHKDQHQKHKEHTAAHSAASSAASAHGAAIASAAAPAEPVPAPAAADTAAPAAAPATAAAPAPAVVPAAAVAAAAVPEAEAAPPAAASQDTHRDRDRDRDSPATRPSSTAPSREGSPRVAPAPAETGEKKPLADSKAAAPKPARAARGTIVHRQGGRGAGGGISPLALGSGSGCNSNASSAPPSPSSDHPPRPLRDQPAHKHKEHKESPSLSASASGEEEEGEERHHAAAGHGKPHHRRHEKAHPHHKKAAVVHHSVECQTEEVSPVPAPAPEAERGAGQEAGSQTEAVVQRDMTCQTETDREVIAAPVSVSVSVSVPTPVPASASASASAAPAHYSPHPCGDKGATFLSRSSEEKKPSPVAFNSPDPFASPQKRASEEGEEGDEGGLEEVSLPSRMEVTVSRRDSLEGDWGEGGEGGEGGEVDEQSRVSREAGEVQRLQQSVQDLTVRANEAAATNDALQRDCLSLAEKLNYSEDLNQNQGLLFNLKLKERALLLRELSNQVNLMRAEAGRRRRIEHATSARVSPGLSVPVSAGGGGGGRGRGDLAIGGTNANLQPAGQGHGLPPALPAPMDRRDSAPNLMSQKDPWSLKLDTALAPTPDYDAPRPKTASEGLSAYSYNTPATSLLREAVPISTRIRQGKVGGFTGGLTSGQSVARLKAPKLQNTAAALRSACALPARNKLDMFSSSGGRFGRAAGGQGQGQGGQGQGGQGQGQRPATSHHATFAPPSPDIFDESGEDILVRYIDIYI
jgi:hypothetical protein